MTRFFVCALALVATAAGPVAAQPRATPSPFRERHLALSADVDFAQGRIDGSARLTLENWTGQPAEHVSLLLNRLMLVRSAHEGDRALSVSQDVVRFEDDSMRQVTLADVRLAHPIAPGARVTLDVAFGGNLVGYTETGSLYIKDHVDSAFTILRVDAYAFPSVGVASDAANRRHPSVDFTYDLDLGVAPGEIVSVAGTLVSHDSSGGVIRWRYHNERPSPFLNVCIAPYAMLDRGGIRVAYFPPDSIGAPRLAASADSALALLAQWFGPLGAEARLTISEIPEGWGSQASLAAGIIQEAGAFRERGPLRAVYHELSHLWNATDNDRPSPRWNEGLASFLQLRLAEAIDGDTTRTSTLAKSVTRVRAMLDQNPRLRTVPPIDYGRESLTDYSYHVGQLMFAVLFELAGERTFDRIVGGYFQEKRVTGGTTEDFMRYGESVGGATLEPFFRDWLRTTRWAELVGRGMGVGDIVETYRQR